LILNKIKLNSVDLLNCVFFILLLFYVFSTLNKIEIWKFYADSFDYLQHSRISFFSIDFFAPQKTNGFFPRPFTIGLIYKLANGQPSHIILLQQIIHCFSCFIFGYVIIKFLSSNTSKLFFLFFWYLLMSTWNIVGWTHTLLSESLSISFFFIWLSSFLVLFHVRNIYVFLIHIVVTILFSFTRDSWPYILILFYCLTLIILCIKKMELLKFTFTCVIFSIVLFFFQQWTARIGERYKLPIINNIVLRILPNEEYLKWFADRGLPNSMDLKNKYGNLNHWKDIYPLYSDPQFLDFRQWVGSEGKSLYSEFLLKHPFYSIDLLKSKDFQERSNAYNLDYIGKNSGKNSIAEKIFPLFNLKCFLFLNFVLVFIIYFKNQFINIFPLLLSFIILSNAVIIYIADSLEIERHLYMTNILIQFSFIVIFTVLIDFIISNEKIRKIKEHFIKSNKIQS